MYVDYSIARYEQVAVLHIVLLAIAVALVVGIYQGGVRPYVREVRQEAVAVAGLLSHTPREMDVMSHVRGVLVQCTGRKR